MLEELEELALESELFKRYILKVKYY